MILRTGSEIFQSYISCLTSVHQTSLSSNNNQRPLLLNRTPLHDVVWVAITQFSRGRRSTVLMWGESLVFIQRRTGLAISNEISSWLKMPKLGWCQNGNSLEDAMESAHSKPGSNFGNPRLSPQTFTVSTIVKWLLKYHVLSTWVLVMCI